MPLRAPILVLALLAGIASAAAVEMMPCGGDKKSNCGGDSKKMMPCGGDKKGNAAFLEMMPCGGDKKSNCGGDKKSNASFLQTNMRLKMQHHANCQEAIAACAKYAKCSNCECVDCSNNSGQKCWVPKC